MLQFLVLDCSLLTSREFPCFLWPWVLEATLSPCDVASSCRSLSFGAPGVTDVAEMGASALWLGADDPVLSSSWRASRAECRPFLEQRCWSTRCIGLQLVARASSEAALSFWACTGAALVLFPPAFSDLGPSAAGVVDAAANVAELMPRPRLRSGERRRRRAEVLLRNRLPSSPPLHHRRRLQPFGAKLCWSKPYRGQRRTCTPGRPPPPPGTQKPRRRRL